MSTNCIRCIKAKQTGADLLCDVCRAKPWPRVNALEFRPDDGGILRPGSLKANSVAWPPRDDDADNRRHGIVGDPRVFRLVPIYDAGDDWMCFDPAKGGKLCHSLAEAKQWCEQREITKLNGGA